MTAETREKLAAAQKVAWTPERREKAKALRGEKHPNFGRKNSSAEIERKRQWMLANNPMRDGHTDESRTKMSLAHRNMLAEMDPRLVKYGISPETYRAELAVGNRWCCKGKHFVPIGGSGRPHGACAQCRRESGEARPLHLRSKYGVDQAWYDAKFAEQGGVCAICGSADLHGRKYLAIDHNHGTGASRGLLCIRCNAALARIESIPDWGIRATVYLDCYR
jgi:hypothetical protein